MHFRRWHKKNMVFFIHEIQTYLFLSHTEFHLIWKKYQPRAISRNAELMITLHTALCSIILNRLRKIQTTQRKQSAAGIFDVPKINKRPKTITTIAFRNVPIGWQTEILILPFFYVLTIEVSSSVTGKEIVRDFIECRITSNWLTRESESIVQC